MPEKFTKDGRRYEIDGKKFKWFPFDDDDRPADEPIIIPMRIKLGLVLDMSKTNLDTEGMSDFLLALIPGSEQALREMDVNDFQEMFGTWQKEYNMLTGATLGESSSSSA